MPDGKFVSIDTSGRKVEEKATALGGTGNESKIIMTNASGMIDDSLIPGGETIMIMCSENIAAGDFVDLWSDAGTPKVRKADASAVNAGKSCDGFVRESAILGAQVRVYFEGKNDQLSGLVPGSEYFLSNVAPGGVITTPVTTAGHILQYVGIAINATTIAFEKGEVIIRA